MTPAERVAAFLVGPADQPERGRLEAMVEAAEDEAREEAVEALRELAKAVSAAGLALIQRGKSCLRTAAIHPDLRVRHDSMVRALTHSLASDVLMGEAGRALLAATELLRGTGK